VVGGVLRWGVLRGLEETTVDLSAASMPEQGKRKARESMLGHARKGKRGGVVWCGRCHTEEGGGEEENRAWHPATVWERWRRVLVGRRECRVGAGERDGARGSCVQAWADRGKERAGPGPRATMSILI
jgi:hypothetical protein